MAEQGNQRVVDASSVVQHLYEVSVESALRTE